MGSGEGGALFSLPSNPRATTLNATFTGKLAPLGSVALRWNGAAWVGSSSSGPRSDFAFLNQGETFQLVCAGPGTAFVVSGRPTALSPFCWTAQGEAAGPLSGEFAVTIME